MKPSETHDIDKYLEHLKNELADVHAPRWVEPSNVKVIPKTIDTRRGDTADAPSSSAKALWLTGLAASLVAVAVGTFRWSLSVDVQSTQIAQTPVSGHLVARTITPVTVQSISRGAEVHYLETRLVSDESGLTQVIYVYLPN
ncbi:MAG: hypothetical protein K0U72_09220 [Gammaproteobacteria bacterium]|nr:hypothetical protein [Gammaproteobacteria bacterium]